MVDSLLQGYNFLVVDNQRGAASFGERKKRDLERLGAIATHVYSFKEALAEIKEHYYDVFVIDIHLGSQENGILLHDMIRELGYYQPIVFVTGRQTYLNMTMREFAPFFAAGPVTFWEKNSDIKFEQLLKEASDKVDPMRRAIYIMKENGFDKEFIFEDKVYTIDHLLYPLKESEKIIRELRESFYALIIDLIPSGE